eukprot:6189153-Pleurochrysis_carterae.AAC.2
MRVRGARRPVGGNEQPQGGADVISRLQLLALFDQIGVLGLCTAQVEREHVVALLHRVAVAARRAKQGHGVRRRRLARSRCKATRIHQLRV